MVTISEAKEYIEYAKKLGLLDIFKKKYNILFLGSSGVGKTQLIKSLISSNPELIHYSTRTMSTTKTGIDINKVPFNIIDTVGQDNRKSDRVSAIIDNAKSLDLIINVVCYGYHENTRGEEHAFTQNGKLKEKYLKNNRELEINQLSEWTTFLGGSEAKHKLITIVTKADLWWHDRDKIINYYEKGEYYDALEDCKVLNPIVLHYASTFHMLYDKVPLSGKFDITAQKKARVQLFQALIESVGKGGNSHG